MKQFYTLLLLLVTITLSAQIPSGYYDNATGTGYTLKTQLKQIIDNSNDGLSPEYTSTDPGYGGLYVTYELSDIDLYYENNGTLLDMYSENPNGTDAYEYTYGSSQQDDGSGGTSEGQKFNREHIVPQAVFNSGSPMKNDAHFVVPSDKYVNGKRDNFPFGIVQNATFNFTNGSKRGNNLNSGYSAGYTNTVFEPIDEFKGDIARMIFYFVTRYEDGLTSFDAYDMFDRSAGKAFDDTFLNILYTWHLQDPVTTREIDRNNAIFGRQNNRNPYIDHPEYIFNIWQNDLSVDEFETVDAIKMYPNPSNGNTVTIVSRENLAVEVYDVLGKKIKMQNITSSQNKLNISGLSKGLYLVRFTSSKGSTTKKLIKS